MRKKISLHLLFAVLAAVTTPGFAAPAPQERLLIAVTEPDIEAIVGAVGGNEVETFSLFKGCILRENLRVEPAAENRLVKTGAVVWTGFLNESAAITASLPSATPASKVQAGIPVWIDVSKGAVRVNVPVSNCYGYVDPKSMSGDPFFWLNPKNGSVIARNIAEGLGVLRPDKRAYFLANADAFRAALDKDLQRWKADLKPLSELRIFATQCGWQNFSKIGGPVLAVCKAGSGPMPNPRDLLDRVREMKVQFIIVDPNTPPEYENVFREQSDLHVIMVPSSIEHIPGARSYSALFDNLVQALQAAVKK